MLKSLNLVMPYYQNQDMLQIHINHWYDYPLYTKDKVVITIVDDGSPEETCAEKVLRKAHLKYLPKIKLYKIDKDIPWNMHPARNLGMRYTGKGWAFLTDMDLVLTEENLVKLFMLENPREDQFFTVERKKMPGQEPYKYHPNTFLIHSNTFWKVKGYNTNLKGYGGDGPFKRDLLKVAEEIRLSDVWVEYYGRTYVHDSGTNNYDRQGHYKEMYRKSFDDPKNRIKWDPIPQDMPWHEVDLYAV